MGAIYLIRHGQASFGQANYDQLSKVGEEQGAVLGRHFKAIGLQADQVICGGMQRHAQTADQCLQHMGYSGERAIDEGYNEYNHEEVLARYKPEFAEPQGIAQAIAREANPKAAFQRLFAAAVERWVLGEHDADYSESWRGFSSRCAQALENSIAAGGSGHNTLVFTSGGAISILAQAALDLSDRQAFELNWIIANSSVTRLIYGKGRPTLSYFNNYSHVEGDRRLLTYR